VAFLFNAVIDSLDPRELEMSGRKFTWANSRRVPTYERLDRVLVSTEWEQNFPLVTVEALNSEISDHTPLLLSTGEKTKGTYLVETDLFMQTMQTSI
jgi:exonuclease III